MRISNIAGYDVKTHDVFDAICSAKKKEMLHSQNMPFIHVKSGTIMEPYKNNKTFQKPFEIKTEDNFQIWQPNDDWGNSTFSAIKMNIGEPFATFAMQYPEDKAISLYIAEKQKLRALKKELVSSDRDKRISAIQEIDQPKGEVIGMFQNRSSVTVPLKRNIEAIIDPETVIVIHGQEGLELNQRTLENSLEIAVSISDASRKAESSPASRLKQNDK